MNRRHGDRDRGRALRTRGDEGIAEFVVIFPIFFFLVIAGIQFALWSHAAHLARSAAEVGSQAASGYGASLGSGTTAATSFISTAGGGTLTGSQVQTTTLAGDVAQVTVTGKAEVLIPWLTLNVKAVSDAPVQEFRSK